MRVKRGILVLLWAVLLPSVSCTSTKLTGSWVDQDFEDGPITSVMVIGVSRNETTRRLYEDTFVRKLAEKNVKAVASYSRLDSSEKLERDVIRGAVDAAGVESVLITRVVGVNRKTEYYQPTYTHARYYGSMYGYYGRAYDDVYTPGYLSSYKVYELESTLYGGDSGKLIWSARSEMEEPDDLGKEISVLVGLLINDLIKKKVL